MFDQDDQIAKRFNGSPYFSLHGSDKDGWSLMLYRYSVSEVTGQERDDVRVHWLRPKLFPTLKDALAELIQHAPEMT